VIRVGIPQATLHRPGHRSRRDELSSTLHPSEDHTFMTTQRDNLDTLNPGDTSALKRALINRLIYSIGKDPLETRERD